MTYWTIVDDEDFQVAQPFGDFLLHLRVSGGAESTTRQYASTFAEWATWIQARDLGDDPMRWAEQLGLFRFHLLSTLVARRGRGHGRVRSEPRVDDMLAAIRSFYKWAIPRGRAPRAVSDILYEIVEPRGGFDWLETMPDRVTRAVHSSGHRASSDPICVTAEEFDAMLAAPGLLRDKLLIALLGLEGLRVEEAVTLMRQKMHLAPNSTALGCGIRGPHIHVVGKGNKSRWIPANSYLVTVYSTHLLERAEISGAEASDFVLVNVRGGEIGAPLTTGRARRIVAALAKRAGITRHVTPHQFRHGLATRLIEANRSIDEVQRILGHAHVNTTRRYITTSAKRMFEAIDAVPPPGAVRS